MCVGVLLVSATEALELDEDLPLLRTALDRRETTHDVVSWNDRSAMRRGSALGPQSAAIEYAHRLIGEDSP